MAMRWLGSSSSHSCSALEDVVAPLMAEDTRTTCACVCVCVCVCARMLPLLHSKENSMSRTYTKQRDLTVLHTHTRTQIYVCVCVCVCVCQGRTPSREISLNYSNLEDPPASQTLCQTPNIQGDVAQTAWTHAGMA